MCVWNVSIDEKLLPYFFFGHVFRRGPGTHDCLSWPTKTRQHGGANVPAISHLLLWDVANPRITSSNFTDIDLLHARIPQSEHGRLFYSTGLSFRSISELSAELRVGNLWIGLHSRLSNFLHGYSDGYFVEDPPTSLSSLVVHVRDSVPNRSDDGSISCLVCARVFVLCPRVVASVCQSFSFVNAFVCKGVCLRKLQPVTIAPCKSLCVKKVSVHNSFCDFLCKKLQCAKASFSNSICLQLLLCKQKAVCKMQASICRSFCV